MNLAYERLLAAVVILVSLGASPLEAQSWTMTCLQPGQILTSPDGSVQLVCGNSANLMSIPHNGTGAPSGMSARTADYCTTAAEFWTGNDQGAALLASYIAQAYYAQSGKHLWRVRNLVSRTYLDPNRQSPCATGGNAAAEVALAYYHQAMRYALDRINGRGFVWDLHTNGTHDQRIELAYLLPPDAFYDPEPHAEQSSIRAFVTDGQQSFTQVLRDLGTRLRRAGYPAIPSESQWEPEPGDAFFQGGHLLQTYACPSLTDLICGVQVEIHKGLYKSSTAQQQLFAVTFATIMRQYLAQFGILW
jgi:hypothetical protein